MNTAYPVVGGRLIVDLARQNVNAETIAISISFDGGKTWKDVQTSFASDYDRMYVDLNPFFPKTDPARYDYILRFTLQSHSDKPEVALKGFTLHSTLEMAPLAMPGVVLGENHFIFSDDSPSGTKVRITHVWNECDADLANPGCSRSCDASRRQDLLRNACEIRMASGFGRSVGGLSVSTERIS